MKFPSWFTLRTEPLIYVVIKIDNEILGVFNTKAEADAIAAKVQVEMYGDRAEQANDIAFVSPVRIGVDYSK